MRREELEGLVDAGETLDVEFKGEERHPLNDGDLVETVVGLANRPGDRPGVLLIGVEDDGRITGARPRHEAGITDPLRVQALISNRTRPALTCRAELVQVQGHEVLVIEVPAVRTPVGTSDGKYLRRTLTAKGEPQAVPFHFHEMQSLQADRGLLDYSALPVREATWADLDPLEFERYRRSIRESMGQGDQSLLQLTDIELAKALGAVEANHQVTAIRVLGLLLFGREEAIRRLLPTHEAAFQVLAEGRVRMNDFLRWPLIRLMDEFLGRFRAYNREDEVMVGMLRIGVPDCPERAFREGLANALIHRDYTRLGTIHVQWRDDGVEISSPGGFPDGVRLDNLLVTSPRPRNPLLADAFKRAGIVERTARGIDTIFHEQLRVGRPPPTYRRSTSTGVSLLLPGGPANLTFVEFLVGQAQAGKPLGLEDLLLLEHLLRERELQTAGAAQLIQTDEAEARGRLQHLVEGGLVEARGSGRARSYILSAATYRRLGQKVAYVRQKGFNRLQQEQMVLQFVQAHGQITRSQVVELCQLTVPQASYLLGKLVKAGKLLQAGKPPRGSHYVLKSPAGGDRS